MQRAVSTVQDELLICAECVCSVRFQESKMSFFVYAECVYSVQHQQSRMSWLSVQNVFAVSGVKGQG